MNPNYIPCGFSLPSILKFRIAEVEFEAEAYI
jgi:hypothetical protein